MGLLDYPKFTYNFGFKIGFVWLVVAWAYTDYHNQSIVDAFTDPPDWAWVTLISLGGVWLQYKFA